MTGETIISVSPVSYDITIGPTLVTVSSYKGRKELNYDILRLFPFV